MDNIFSEIDHVNASQDVQKLYFLPGHYRVKLDNVLTAIPATLVSSLFGPELNQLSGI